ncbi:unnamed protein product, partial [Urochloa humidicola]
HLSLPPTDPHARDAPRLPRAADRALLAGRCVRSPRRPPPCTAGRARRAVGRCPVSRRLRRKSRPRVLKEEEEEGESSWDVKIRSGELQLLLFQGSCILHQ